MCLCCKKLTASLYISNRIRYNNIQIRNGGLLKWDEQKLIKKLSCVERQK